MDRTSVMIMIGICAVGTTSLLLMIVFFHLRPHLRPLVNWYKNKIHQPLTNKNSERLVMNYLQHQQIQHVVFVHNGEPLSLYMFLNQSELEFSQADLNHSQLRTALETALETVSTHHQAPNLPMASVNQIPQGHSQLLCLALAGFSIAKAAFSLIGSDEYIHSIHPKIIKKITTPTIMDSPIKQLIPTLKAANPFPWSMVSNAIDYWSVNPTLVNQYRLYTELHIDQLLIKDTILVGYQVGIRDNLIKHYANLAT